MSRTKPPRLTDEQREWLNGWARTQIRLLERVQHALKEAGHDITSEYVDWVEDMLFELRRGPMVKLPAGLWPENPTRGYGALLRDDQIAALGEFSGATYRKCKKICTYLERAGVDSCNAYEAVTSTMNGAADIGYAYQRLRLAREGKQPYGQSLIGDR